MSVANKMTVIVLPGITGSELLNSHGKRVWPPRLPTILQDFNSLHMRGDGTSLHTITPGPPIGDFYHPMLGGLAKQGFSTVGFGYDWRLPNRVNAERLAEFIASCNTTDVALVAHSMGGIVALQYLANAATSAVKKLVLVGTPLLGTPATLKLLEIGDFVPNGFGKVLRPLFNKVFRSSPAWHEILPSPEYFTTVSPTGRTMARTFKKGQKSPEWQVSDYEGLKALLAQRNWYQNFPIGIQLQKDQILAVVNRMDTQIYAGTQIPTLTQIDYSVGRKSELHVANVRYGDGDGAVVLESATLGTTLRDRCKILPQDHAKLFQSESTIADIAKYLYE